MLRMFTFIAHIQFNYVHIFKSYYTKNTFKNDGATFNRQKADSTT